ncbi:MAG: hypothetical protein ACYDB5_10750 [bacterium]
MKHAQHKIIFGKTKDGMGYLLEKECIAKSLAVKGIYEYGDYSIQPLNIGDYNLFTVKYRTSSVSPIYDDLNAAINLFLKLTNN